MFLCRHKKVVCIVQPLLIINCSEKWGKNIQAEAGWFLGMWKPNQIQIRLEIVNDLETRLFQNIYNNFPFLSKNISLPHYFDRCDNTDSCHSWFSSWVILKNGVIQQLRRQNFAIFLPPPAWRVFITKPGQNRHFWPPPPIILSM